MEWTYLLLIPGLILGMYAQFKLSSTYSRYVRVRINNGLSGAAAARAILDDADLHDMPVREVGGHLTDHYDPTKRALFLSSENFHGNSIAAVGVAAHEAGHALQHKAAYAPLQLRMTLVPVTKFASVAWVFIFMLGVFAGGPWARNFIAIAIGLFALVAFFQLITLPVEYDASRRAKAQLLKLGLVHPQESGAVGQVLNAAALTYVAALVMAVLNLLRLLIIARSRN
jgi:Zn-dependent membrane protease YugP